MLRNYFLVFIAFISLFSPIATSAYAVENPLAVPNNRIGIHILFPTEIQEAARLVNSNGGDWGYVTIPIQSGDKDLIKWQGFMDQAKKLHVIPIIRLATEGDYFNTKVWRKPGDNDILDFANFLDSLNWPTKNRYIIAFNEVNRADEWGGSLNPEEYADILSFTASVFKAKSPDYFIISAGLDNAAPTSGDQYMNEFQYLRAMNATSPGIFCQIDGMASHSYPNPGFSQPPDGTDIMGIESFHYEQDLIKSTCDAGKELPVFITETGWSANAVPDDTRAQYMQLTLSSFWNDKTIVAVTPFLLEAGGDPFAQFSFINVNGSPTKQYTMLTHFPKIKGTPSFAPQALADTARLSSLPLTARDFSKGQQRQKKFHVTTFAQNAFNFLLGL